MYIILLLVAYPQNPPLSGLADVFGRSGPSSTSILTRESPLQLHGIGRCACRLPLSCVHARSKVSGETARMQNLIFCHILVFSIHIYRDHLDDPKDTSKSK